MVQRIFYFITLWSEIYGLLLIIISFSPYSSPCYHPSPFRCSNPSSSSFHSSSNFSLHPLPSSTSSSFSSHHPKTSRSALIDPKINLLRSTFTETWIIHPSSHLQRISFMGIRLSSTWPIPSLKRSCPGSIPLSTSNIRISWWSRTYSRLSGRYHWISTTSRTGYTSRCGSSDPDRDSIQVWEQYLHGSHAQVERWRGQGGRW